MARGKKRFASVEQFEEWVDDITAARFDRKKVYAAGNWAALFDALQAAIDHADNETERQLADDDPITIPFWVARGLTHVFGRHLAKVRSAGGNSLKAGRSPKRWVEQYERDLVDWHRFKQIWYRRIARREDSPNHPKPTEARRNRKAFREEAIKRARASNREPVYTIDMSTPYSWAQSDNDDLDVFQAVAEVFKNSAYRGSRDEMKKSYERVNSALKRGEAWRYYPSKWVRFPSHLRTSEEDLPR